MVFSILGLERSLELAVLFVILANCKSSILHSMAGAPTTEYSNLGISEYPLYFILFTVSAVLVQAVAYYIKNRHL